MEPSRAPSQALDVLLAQTRSATAPFVLELSVVLPDHTAVLVRAVPDLSSVILSAIAADQLCRKWAEAVMRKT